MPLIECRFSSPALGMCVSMNVILPQYVQRLPDVPPEPAEPPFPVLYLLHGLSDDHTIWSRRTSIERYVDGLGLAVVMPAVNRSFYTDMAHGGKYWTFISEELPDLARRLFGISTAREDNFVAGLSMGGYGALKLALRQPHRFAAAAALSGALDIAALIAQMREENPDRTQEFADVFGDLDAVPGSDNDLLALTRKAAESGADIPALYQACGTEDFLYAQNVSFRDHLRRLRIAAHYEEGPGRHEWGYWDMQIQKVLAWLPLRNRA